MSPFDYLNSINMTKKNLMIDEQSEKDYVPFIVNRGLGYFQDTVLLANEMNVNCHIDSKLQYDFLKGTISKRKRFSKWLKAEDDEKVDIIRKYFGYNHTVAKSVSHLFNVEQLNTLKKRLDKGGHSKR